MRIIPVLDIKNGLVVRGIAGVRSEYRPIVSRLCDRCDPQSVAEAFRVHFGMDELYLADLDAIGGVAAPDTRLYESLHRAGFRLLVDAGLRDADDARPLRHAAVSTIVAGLETIAGPEELGAMLQLLGPERLLFSLDMAGGELLANRDVWPEPEACVSLVVGLGVRRVLLLDLARVGVGQGIGTETLASRVARSHPGLELIVGGGVRDADDLSRLEGLGIAGVLVASALHDQRITADDLRRFSRKKAGTSDTGRKPN